MKEERVPLTKSQKALYEAWSDDYGRVMKMIGNIITDNLNGRLSRLAEENGLNMDEDWMFDHEKLEFYKRELEDPKLIVPGSK